MAYKQDVQAAHVKRRGYKTQDEAYMLFLMNQMSLKGRPSRAIDPRLLKTWGILEEDEGKRGSKRTCVPKKTQMPKLDPLTRTAMLAGTQDSQYWDVDDRTYDEDFD